MKLKSIVFLNIFVSLLVAFLIAEFWVRKKNLVGLGTDRIPHPYISVGGFYRGGYFGNTMDPAEEPRAYGYVNKSWMNLPSFEYGTPVRSASERGKFLYRDRARLLTMPKPKDEYRIFILGGSVAYGEGASSPDQRWYVHLEKILRLKTGKNIVVIPAANHSHVTTQERVIFDLYVAPFNPDMLIFLDGFNDANTGIFNVRPGDPGEQSILYAIHFSPFFGWVRDLSKHSELLRYLMQKAVADIVTTPHSDEENKIQAESVANVYFDNLTQVKRRCSVEKIECLFFLQPLQDLTLANRKEKPLNVRDMVVMNYSELRKQIKNYSFVIDFTGVFDQEPAQVPFYDPAHFHDEGHRVLAEKMANLILSKKHF